MKRFLVYVVIDAEDSADAEEQFDTVCPIFNQMQFVEIPMVDNVELRFKGVKSDIYHEDPTGTGGRNVQDKRRAPLVQHT